MPASKRQGDALILGCVQDVLVLWSNNKNRKEEGRNKKSKPVGREIAPRGPETGGQLLALGRGL